MTVVAATERVSDGEASADALVPGSQGAIEVGLGAPESAAAGRQAQSLATGAAAGRGGFATPG